MGGVRIPDALLRAVALAAALTAAITWLMAGHQAAEAGHIIGAISRCSSPPPNNTCRYLYSFQGENLLPKQKSFHIWNFRFATNWYPPSPTPESASDPDPVCRTAYFLADHAASTVVVYSRS